nr:MAG TPA: hypothetical protein [Caudoviricetes sp.]
MKTSWPNTKHHPHYLIVEPCKPNRRKTLQGKQQHLLSFLSW